VKSNIKVESNQKEIFDEYINLRSFFL